MWVLLSHAQCCMWIDLTPCLIVQFTSIYTVHRIYFVSISTYYFCMILLPEVVSEPKLANLGFHNGLMQIQNDFFLPASKKRRIQKRPETEDMHVSGCKDVANGSSLVLNSKRRRGEKAVETDCKQHLRRQKQTMPKEVAECNSSMKPEIQETSSSVQYDLMMEAKLAAKENAQLCGGRPTHPFFSQHKPAQRTSISAGLTANLSSQSILLEAGEMLPAPPFHVTQLTEVETYSKDDHSNSAGILMEKRIVHSAHKRNFENLDSKITVRLLRPSFNGESAIARIGKRPQKPPFDDSLQPLLTFLKNHENDSRDEGTEEEDENYSRMYLEKRVKSFSYRECLGRLSEKLYSDVEFTSPTQNMLWIDVYQPQSPEEVCGNKEMISKLDAWLQRWKIKSVSSEMDNTVSSNDGFDEDYGWFEGDANHGIEFAENDVLQNVMFLTGPVGCGKTTAIYACAKTHGFTVIEVNCSDNRNGMLIKQKFSESMESHRLGKWSAEMTGVNTVLHSRTEKVSSSRDIFSSQRSISKQSNKEVHEKLGSSPMTDKLQASTNAEDQPDMFVDNEKSMTILLFEDVNMVLEDDRGFMAAVAQVATTAKRPIILTSNDKEYPLPHNIGAQMLEFKKPSTKDLVVLAYLVCTAERVICNPECLREIVHVCRHDVRELLNYLQFWCQGQHIDRLNETEADKTDSVTNDLRSKGELQEVDMGTMIALFTLEAQHRLWPAYLPISFPCDVTKSIASRLSSMLCEVENRLSSMERKLLEQRIVKKRVFVKKMTKRNAINTLGLEATKNVDDITEQSAQLVDTPVKNLKEAKIVARSPVLREKIKRKLTIVMADSDDENDDDKNHYHKDVLQTPIADNRRSGTEIDTLQSTTTVLASESSGCEKRYSCHLEEPSVEFEDIVLHADSSRSSNVWPKLCNSREEHGLLLSFVSKEPLPVVLSISRLSDILSACDIMSSAHNGLQTEDMLASCDDGLLQISAELAHHALKLCVQECCELPICGEDVKGSDLMEDTMLISVNDPSALGGVATEGATLSHRRIRSEVVRPPSSVQDLKRLENRFAIQHHLCNELSSRAQRSFHGGSFFESASFLSRMMQLEQERSAFSLANRRRGRDWRSQFSSHPWNLSQRSIGALQRFGTFGKSGSC